MTVIVCFLILVCFGLMFQWRTATLRNDELEERLESGARILANLRKECAKLCEELNDLQPKPATAADILKGQPTRLRIRRSWQDIEHQLEQQHDTKRQNHNRLTREIESAVTISRIMEEPDASR